MAEWYGNRDWPSGTTVHARLDGTSFETLPVPIDSNWHTWRCTWTEAGLYFWMDYHDGMEPYLTVDANSLDDWPFNDPGYTLQPMLNLAVAGSGGGDPAGGSYPAEMLVDYVRVW
ncbi:putative beta-1,3-glucanase [Mycobacteroides abscessus subsp. abscessus]|nr:putative beta-1,3-glucanase [Mycobacteroides abscessus subsp. abscessus]SKW08209.1 putative beta-1,3-glucanase [Mycobacteroides abscessus subsp. abscessus]